MSRLADGRLLTVPSHGLSPVCAQGDTGSQLSGASSYKDTHPITSQPTLLTSFNLNYFLQGPVAQQMEKVLS